MRFVLSLALLLLLGSGSRAADFFEIPTDEKPLQAVLYRPSGDGPFSAIIAVHDCDGLKNSHGVLRPTIEDWGKRLSEAGYVVLYPDSFGSRGLERQCRTNAARLRPDRERLADVRAARDWLQQQDFVRKDRITLLGWANGGVTVLWAVRPNLTPSDDRPDFRSAAVLYPGCRRLGDTAWSARVPTLILLGALDDWAPAKNCEQMVAGARGRSARAVVVKYKGAHHFFDRENLQLRERRGVAFSADGSGRVTVGTNQEARADAIKRVPEWFAR
jgi:dienelactone hydrolase